MAKVLKTSISVVLDDQDLNKTSRFMDEAVSHEPMSFDSGETNLNGNTLDYQLATSVNQVVLISTMPFSVKIGDTTSSEHSNMKFFAYDGESTDIFVSNKNTDAITIKHTSATYSTATVPAS